MSAVEERGATSSIARWRIVSVVLLLALMALAIGGWQLHCHEVWQLKKRQSDEMNIACTRMLIDFQIRGMKNLKPQTLTPFLPYARRKDQPDGRVRYYWSESWVGGGCFAWITMDASGVVDWNHECQEF